MKKTKHLFSHQLSNGLQILIRPCHHIPKVSTQLWYRVGSKNEKSGEKGIAHLIEHMIFKGTKNLSESDINVITHKLSGSCNAFTSYDYTGYLFDFPTQHWHQALPMMADCMINCTFKEELLASELKAVIQELKMYKDNYVSHLAEEMIASIFQGHPYHYPIIGYKNDLWNLNRGNLHAFYKKYYSPNNATLVVVGDVDPEDVVAQAEKYFDNILSQPEIKREEYYLRKDLISQSVFMKRDIQQPSALFAFTVPGAQAKSDYALDVISFILGSGKSSRLYKKLVDGLQIATEVDSFVYDLFEEGLFFIYVQPRLARDIGKIIEEISHEIVSIQQQGFLPEEISSAAKRSQSQLVSVLENNQKQAYLLGKTYLATGDADYMFDSLQQSPEEVGKEALKIVKECFLPSLMHKGMVLPLQENEREYWVALQKLSDEEDARVLLQHVRKSPVEEAVQAKKIQPQTPRPFDYPKAEKTLLENGLTLLSSNNPNIPKITLLLDFKAKHYYDPGQQEGLYNFLSEMLTEGTVSYPGKKLAEVIESNGMSLEVGPGQIQLTCLKDDFEKALSIFYEVVAKPELSKSVIKKIKLKSLTELKSFWDEPLQFSHQIIKEHVYKGHPYSKNPLGSKESLKSVTEHDIRKFYEQIITPSQSVLAVVGDVSAYDVPNLVEKTLGKWQGLPLQEVEFPQLLPTDPLSLQYPINRDQVVLYFAGLSVDRMNPDFDALLLFDQIFGGGVLGSMNSRLFAIREQSGLFYTIAGSLLAMAGKQPGMAMVRTIVSLDRLAEAEQVIAQTINSAADSISEEEYQEAQNALAASLVDNFASNQNIASSFIFLERYQLPTDYFDTRVQQLKTITAEQMKETAKKVLNTNRMCVLKVGRVG